MVASLPTVVSGLAAIRAGLSHENCRILADPDDPEELARAILRLLREDNPRVSLGRNECPLQTYNEEDAVIVLEGLLYDKSEAENCR
jgi:hypothetical protein